MNPIPIQKKIEDLLKKLDHPNPEFESLVWYDEDQLAIWTSKSCPNEEKRSLCMAILRSALNLQDPIVSHEIDNTKTTSIHWSEGVIVLSGDFDSEKILQEVVHELRIAV